MYWSTTGRPPRGGSVAPTRVATRLLVTMVELWAKPGTDFPRNEGEFRAWFQDDNACLDYVDWLRWGNALVCTGCGVLNNPRPVNGRV